MTLKNRDVRTQRAQNAGEHPFLDGLSGVLREAARVLTSHPEVGAMIVARRPALVNPFEYLTIAEHRWPGPFEEVGWERTHRVTR